MTPMSVLERMQAKKPEGRPEQWSALSTTLYADSGIANNRTYIIGVVNQPGYVLRRVTVCSPIAVHATGSDGYTLQVRTYTQDKDGTTTHINQGSALDTTLVALKALEVKQIHLDKDLNYPCPRGTVVAVYVTHNGTPAGATLLTHPSFQAELYYRGA